MTSTPKTIMEGSYPNVNEGEIFPALTTFRFSRGYIEVPSSAPLVPKTLKSRDFQSEPSTSGSHSFFGPMDSQPQSLRSLYSAQEEIVRQDSFPDSGINVRTPNSGASSQKRYPSPLSTRLIQSTTLAPGEVPTRPVPSHSPLRNEVSTQQEQVPLIPQRPAPLPPNHSPTRSFHPAPVHGPSPKPHTKPFKCVLNFFSNIDDKYTAYLARRQNDKKFKFLVKAGKKEDEEKRKKINEGMRGQVEAHREKERVANEEAEMEKARKRQRQIKKDSICRRRRLERDKKRLSGAKTGWRSKLQSKLRNLFLPTLSFPWNKKKTQQSALQNEREQREIDFERRWQRAEARRTMRERERGGVLGRQVFEPNRRPFEDMGTARRESRFRETIREVGSESHEYYDEDEDYNSSDEGEIAGQVRGQPFSYYHYRHTVG